MEHKGIFLGSSILLKTIAPPGLSSPHTPLVPAGRHEPAGGNSRKLCNNLSENMRTNMACQRPYAGEAKFSHRFT